MSEELFPFSKFLREMHAEIGPEYVPGAMAWADREHDDAWTKANDRLDAALVGSIERGDHFTAKLEQERYAKTIMDLIHKYKRSIETNEAQMFLDGLSQ